MNDKFILSVKVLPSCHYFSWFYIEYSNIIYGLCLVSFDLFPWLDL